MRVISTFLRAASFEGTGVAAVAEQGVLAVFDTLYGDKRLVVGITVGSAQSRHIDDVRLASPVGQAVMDRMLAHHALHYPGGAVVLAGVAQVPGAKQRVGQVLAQAPDQAAVLLLCANNKVYDAAWDALGIDLNSARQDTQ